VKAVILAGGFGTRISEESHLKPKPLIEIGGKPILWHIMKIYSSQGVTDFIICLGYKGYLIKEYFMNYSIHMSDVTFDMSNNSVEIHNKRAEPWRVTLIDTGENTMTGGRIKRIGSFIGNEPFMLTYGDGVANINIAELLAFHERHGKFATITAVQPPGKFGALQIDDVSVCAFTEKPHGDGGWINGGFFVLQPEVINFITGDDTVWEKDPLESLANRNDLVAYKHYGFWKCMDTLRDKIELDAMCNSGQAPWMTW